MSAGRENGWAALKDCLPSRDFDPAGVKGGECMAEPGGDTLGESALDPALRCLLLGVLLPEGTCNGVLAHHISILRFSEPYPRCWLRSR